MKMLVVYASRTGKTKKMAEYIAEGVRFAGGEAVVVPFTKVKSPEDFAGYDGYAFGSPTYHKDIIGGMKSWLFKVQKAGLSGKVGGAFGSHTHSGESAGILYDTMEHVFHMNMEGLGPFKLTETAVESDEGLHACQQFGRALAERAEGQ